MKKIPTIFLRDWGNDPSRVTREPNPEAEWLFDNPSAALATVKKDGTNVRLTIKQGDVAGLHLILEKRRNPSKKEKKRAEAAGLPTPEPTYVRALPDDPADKHIFKAMYETDYRGWPDGVWECEALGPKIQGGVESDVPVLYPFSFEPEVIANNPMTAMNPFEVTPIKIYEVIEEYLAVHEVEGIVWHGPGGRGGRMAKIKRRDFGLDWPVRR